ncbi:MAG: penicillin-binding protein [Paenibacillaceae bacterium]|nr:penicillin-binding protein [Paenibacillaceae bacterium]
MGSKQGSKPKARKPGKRRFSFGKLFVAMGITAAIAIVFALIGYMVIIYNGQNIFDSNKDKLDMMEASIIYDGSDQEVAVLARQNREMVDKDEIPRKVANAFIATEDRRFNEHAGVDLWAIGRALVKDVVARSVVEGGSTITQQLAKNLFLDSEKTFFRKGTEMSIALALEENLDKDEILQLYLNRIYFGKGAYGIKAASKLYFGKADLNTLDTWEIATLAAIPKAPSVYSPLADAEKSKERRNVVLKLMYDQGYITEEEKNKSQAMEFVPQPGKGGEFPAFIDYMITEAAEKFKLEEEVLRRGGYKIYTTMNVEAQRILEQSFNNPKLFQKDGPEQKMQGSMVIVDNKDGGLLAMSGGRDYENKGLNRALAQRQPGSAFKPLIVYAPALELAGDRFNPYTLLNDEQKSYNNYSPRNYDGVYKGQVTMFEAVRKSINAPAVWLLNEIGVAKGMDFVGKMGIKLDSPDRNLAIALGGLTKGVSPLQMAQAYSAFPNNGTMNAAHSIRKIVDSEGGETVAKVEKTKVMSPKTAYYMTELLKGVVDGGTGTAAKLNRPAAGKTGTTQLDLKGLEKNNRDVWFTGFTVDWTAAVWMGFDKTDTKHYVLPASGSLPAAMFKEVMNKAMTAAKLPVKQFAKPADVPDLKEPPKVVTNLTGEYVKEGLPKVRLAWSGEENNDIGAYQVFRKEAKEGEYKQIAEMVKGTFEFNDISVKPGDSYEYYVVPFNTQSSQAGANSNVVAVEIPADEASPTPSRSPGASSTPHGSASPGSSTVPGGSVRPGGSAKPEDSASPGRSPTPGSPGGGAGTATPTPTPSPAGSPKVSQAPTATPPPGGAGQPSAGQTSPSPTGGAAGAAAGNGSAGNTGGSGGGQ